MTITSNNPAHHFSKNTIGIHVLGVAWKYPGLARRVASSDLIGMLNPGPIRELVEWALSGQPTDPADLPSEHRRLVEDAMTSPFLVSPEMALSFILTVDFFRRMQISPIGLTLALMLERNGRVVWDHIRGSLQILGLLDEVRDAAFVLDRALEIQAPSGGDG